MQKLYHSLTGKYRFIYIWVTLRVLYKEQELPTLREQMSSSPVFFWGLCCSSFSFCVVILCVFTFWVLCCDIRYDSRIKTIPQLFVEVFMSYLCYLCLLTHSGVICVSNTYFVVVLLYCSSSCVPYVASL